MALLHLIFNFWGNFILFFMALFHFTYQYHTRFLIFPHPHQYLLFPFFFPTVIILVDRGEISLQLWFMFSWWSVMLSISYTCWPFLYLLWWTLSSRILLLFFSLWFSIYLIFCGKHFLPFILKVILGIIIIIFKNVPSKLLQ